jgi:hypothetical protein
MSKQYSVSVVSTEKIQATCNTHAAQGWQLNTAYMTARKGCCETKESAVLIFERE